MAVNIENYVPVVKYNGLNTEKDVTLAGSTTVSGTLSATGTSSLTGQVYVGGTAKKVQIFGTTTTDLDAQSGTATIAQLLGGVYTHNSKTGAGTLTTPTGAEISAGIPNVAVGSSFEVFYYNRGNQTVTLTAGASGVTLYGTVAVTTGKVAVMLFVNTAANTWSVYCQMG